jgi:tRNA pseudouridine55 synthase
MARRPARLHGVLVIDKAVGWTSHDVVARVRRLIGESRVGHGGTLDPAASGVLPVCVGQATRLVEYVSEADKTYQTEIRLGVRTETDDLSGAVVQTAPVPDLTADDLAALLAPFQGPIQQVPPAYAAIKVGGRRLYELARAGQTVTVAPRPVTIHRLEMLDWTLPVLTLLVDCSKGTYIRALARDIGAAAGCGGAAQAIRRLRTGPFTLADALTLPELEARFQPEAWATLALPPEYLVRDRPRLDLGAAETQAWLHGVAAAGPAMADGTVARVHGADSVFLGTGRYDAAAARWRPVKVLSTDDGGKL